MRAIMNIREGNNELKEKSYKCSKLHKIHIFFK